MTRDPRGSLTWLEVGVGRGEEVEVGPGGGAEGVAGADPEEEDRPGAKVERSKSEKRSWIAFDV